MKIHQSGNKIIVTQLNQISDHPVVPNGQLQVFVLVFLNFTPLPILTLFDERDRWTHDAYHGIGWIYAPIYEQENK